MNKKEYFLLCFREQMFLYRSWTLRSMGFPSEPLKERNEPFMINFDGSEYWFLNKEGERVKITDADPKKPLFAVEESVTFDKGDLPNIEEKTKTAYSTAMINILLFIWPFPEPLPYRKERFLGKQLDKWIKEALDEGKISVADYTGKYHQACGRLTVFTQIAVSAATPRSITPSPEALKHRDYLLKKHAHELDDPAILAKIDQEVTAKDIEYIKGDPAEKFFLKGKAYATVRKKQYHIQGGVPRLDDPSKMEIMANSLDEGMTPENMPAAVNNLRSGSYSRAKDTALGGEAAKFANRVFQNVVIQVPDCGDKVGEATLITQADVSILEGRYLVGKSDPLTKADLRKLVGKQVQVRSPGTCKQPQRNYCEVCMGRQVADSGIGLGAQLNAVGNVFMSVSLAAFHGSSLKTTLLTKTTAFSQLKRI
jgi:hypothetical protein